MFDDETKSSIGLPANNKKRWGDRDWKSIDREADKSVDQKLPFLAKGPVLLNQQTTKAPSKYWRLYRRVVPIAHAKSGDRSLAILGQIHTVQTPLVASVQTFWAILYLEGELNLPGEDEMAKEIAEWNAWTRKRYISQGQKFPYSLYDFLPVSSLSILLKILIYSSGISSTSRLSAKISALTLAESLISYLSTFHLTNPKISMESLTSTLHKSDSDQMRGSLPRVHTTQVCLRSF